MPGTTSTTSPLIARAVRKLHGCGSFHTSLSARHPRRPATSAWCLRVWPGLATSMVLAFLICARGHLALAATGTVEVHDQGGVLTSLQIAALRGAAEATGLHYVLVFNRGPTSSAARWVQQMKAQWAGPDRIVIAFHVVQGQDYELIVPGTQTGIPDTLARQDLTAFMAALQQRQPLADALVTLMLHLKEDTILVNAEKSIAPQLRQETQVSRVVYILALLPILLGWGSVLVRIVRRRPRARRRRILTCAVGSLFFGVLMIFWVAAAVLVYRVSVMTMRTPVCMASTGQTSFAACRPETVAVFIIFELVTAVGAGALAWRIGRGPQDTKTFPVALDNSPQT